MKHTWSVTLLLLALFVSTHLIGLFVINHYLPEDQNFPLGIEKPQFEEQTSYLPIIIAILFATIVALVLIKFQAFRLWKFWFFVSIVFTLSISFASVLPQIFAVAFALIVAYFKTFRSNPYIHNIGEVFVYGGIAALFVPVLSIVSITILLLLISVYDMIAVWKTKHMVKLAQFQSQNKIFAGLNVPYKTMLKENVKRGLHAKSVKTNMEQAVLGGGDIGFTLMFSGVMLKVYGVEAAAFVSLVTSIALLGLFYFADKKKFYPAMPFLTMGCFIGYGLVLLLF